MFSAAVCLAAICIKSPSSAFASPAYMSLVTACDLAQAAVQGSKAKAGLPVLQRLRQKASNAMLSNAQNTHSVHPSAAAVANPAAPTGSTGPATTAAGSSKTDKTQQPPIEDDLSHLTNRPTVHRVNTRSSPTATTPELTNPDASQLSSSASTALGQTPTTTDMFPFGFPLMLAQDQQQQPQHTMQQPPDSAATASRFGGHHSLDESSVVPATTSPHRRLSSAHQGTSPPHIRRYAGLPRSSRNTRGNPMMDRETQGTSSTAAATVVQPNWSSMQQQQQHDEPHAFDPPESVPEAVPPSSTSGGGHSLFEPALQDHSSYADSLRYDSHQQQHQQQQALPPFAPFNGTLHSGGFDHDDPFMMDVGSGFPMTFDPMDSYGIFMGHSDGTGGQDVLGTSSQEATAAQHSSSQSHHPHHQHNHHHDHHHHQQQHQHYQHDRPSDEDFLMPLLPPGGNLADVEHFIAGLEADHGVGGPI